MRRTIAILLAAFSVAGILIITLLYSPIRDRRNLDRFVKEVATVEIGKTAMEDFRKSTAQAHIADLNFGCDVLQCSYSLRTENKLLHKLRLAPPSIVQANVTFKDGLASEIYIVFEIGKGIEEGTKLNDDVGLVVRQNADRPSCDPHYDLLLKHRGRRDGSWATVSMDSCASREERERALAISGACLTRIGGCN